MFQDPAKKHGYVEVATGKGDLDLLTVLSKGARRGAEILLGKALPLTCREIGKIERRVANEQNAGGERTVEG